MGGQPEAIIAAGLAPNPRSATPTGDQSRTAPSIPIAEIRRMDVGTYGLMDQPARAVSQPGLAPPGVGWME